MIRLFISEAAPVFDQGLMLTLNPGQSRYLSSVMRLGLGDEVLVFNGRDGEWRARLAAIGKKAVTLELEGLTRPQPVSNGPVLAVALVKRVALENIIEKATELGAGIIQPVITRRANASHTNVERLISIAREAAEQTERLDVPAILTPVKLDAWLERADILHLVFADEDSTHETSAKATPSALDGLHRLAEKASYATASTAILIGPEGGFDDDERRRLRSDARCVAINLGPRILRADTAAISALTLFQAMAGDWR